MCIIIFKPENKIIKESYFKESFSMNPDGIGYSFVREHNNEPKIITKKFMKYNKFLKQFNKDDEANRATSPFLIHFRACSKGTVDINNAHPFAINDSQVFAHNGTIYGIPEDTNKRNSDTFMFNHAILKKLPFGWEKNDGIVNLICATLGSTNKIVLFNKDKSSLIFNKNKGVTEDGVWYSNEHFRGVYYRTQTGKAVRYADVLAEQNKWRNGNNWQNEDRWDEEEWNKAWELKEKQKAEEAKKNKNKGQQKIFDINNNLLCEYCGTVTHAPRKMHNDVFGDDYQLCSYCAESLVKIGGISYVN